MNRRSIFTAVTLAMPAVMALPALAGGGYTAPTPVAALFREWWQLEEELDVIFRTTDEDDQIEGLVDRKLEVEAKMRAAPKTCIEDVALAVFATSDLGMFAISDDVRNLYRTEARALIAA